MLDLFANAKPWQEPLASGAVTFRRSTFDSAPTLLQAVAAVVRQLLFRQMVVPGGYTMSMTMTNCGHLGWTADQHGYLYSPFDPLAGTHWPPPPGAPADLCQRATTTAGYADFQPDVCLINRYTPETKLSLHQDKDKPDLRAPIISVSLGLPAIFQFDGLRRSDSLKRLLLKHSGVVVWDGNSRLLCYGIQPLKTGYHPLAGDCRYSLTFRQAGKKEQK